MTSRKKSSQTKNNTPAEKLQKALDLSYRFLKFRPRTEREITLYLAKKAKRYGLYRALIDDTLKKLRERGYVNDVQFVEWFINQRATLKPKSKSVLKQEMYKLGAARDIVEKALENEEIDEAQLASEAVKKRWMRWQSLDRQTRHAKTTSFLLRRGFSFDLIKKTIESLEDMVQ